MLTKAALGRVTGKSIPVGSPVLLSMLAPEGNDGGIGGSDPVGVPCLLGEDRRGHGGFVSVGTPATGWT